MTDSYGANGWFGDVLNIGDSSFTLDDGAEEIILFQVSEPEDLECPCINPDWISPIMWHDLYACLRMRWS